MRQQNEYLKLADEVEKETKNIKVIRYNTDNEGKYEDKMDTNFGFLFEGE